MNYYIDFAVFIYLLFYAGLWLGDFIRWLFTKY